MKYTIALITLAFFFIQATCQDLQTDDKVADQTTTPTLLKSASVKNDGVIKLQEYTEEFKLGDYPVAILAGGCFWCTEAVFERINGVVDVVSGYAGGGTEKVPSYKAIGSGTTGFAEAIAIFYDPEVVTYETLMDVFFVGHDPTTLNRQGPDAGTQYRSAIFYQSEAELKQAKAAIKKKNESGYYSDPIVTTLEAYDLFWTAETYHQNFYEYNPTQGYVMSVSRPKVQKVIKTFPDLLKEEYK